MAASISGFLRRSQACCPAVFGLYPDLIAAWVAFKSSKYSSQNRLCLGRRSSSLDVRVKAVLHDVKFCFVYLLPRRGVLLSLPLGSGRWDSRAKLLF
jgi:hypothetical protein